LGPLAEIENLGDRGSSQVYPPHVVPPLAGLREGAPEGWEIEYDLGTEKNRVRELAAAADVVLVVAGYTHEDEGEFIPDATPGAGMSMGGDRLDLTLGPAQEAMILAAAEANPKTVVVLMAGSAVLMENWRASVAGILLLWYPGMVGGNALADVIFGRVNPSGRLPFSVPKRAEDLPYFDRDAVEIGYDLWHGYTKLDHDGVSPAFAFGFGLNYTDFAFSNTSVEIKGAKPNEGENSLAVGVDVRNTGAREGTAIVQIYAGPDPSLPDHPLKRLCGFERVSLDANESRRVEIDVSLRDLAFYDVSSECWRLEEGSLRVFVGSSSAEVDLLKETISGPGLTWAS
jgi:beta-glucosidase